MALESAVHDAATGAELEFGEESGQAVLVVDALIVLEEDGTLVIWKNELGHNNDNGKTGFAGNEFIKTNHIGKSISIFKDIPVGAKEACITSTIGHHDGFVRSKTGGKGMDMAGVHVHMNSSLSGRNGCCDGHAKKTGSVTSSLVTA